MSSHKLISTPAQVFAVFAATVCTVFAVGGQIALADHYADAGLAAQMQLAELAAEQVSAAFDAS
jgi:hypothetical protein